MYMLDTNICIYIIKKRPTSVLDKLKKTSIEHIYLSSVVEAELRYGADKSKYPAKNHAALDMFLRPLTVLPFDQLAARSYGRIRAELEKKGKIIGSYDMMIAAHCLANGFKVITNNVREFKRVAGLEVENWAR